MEKKHVDASVRLWLTSTHRQKRERERDGAMNEGMDADMTACQKW